MNGEAQTTTSEAQALAGIATWSGDCPAWQRDALRRLCAADKLDSDDVNALLAICKGSAPGVPLTVHDVRAPAAGKAAVTLKQLSGVQHVNALVSYERLTFDKSGVTVIYGDNGSGKSGYARILKKICRARSGSKIESIHPNIYEANPGVPTASIDFSVNGQNRTAGWTLGQPPDPLLSAVSIFDSRTANIHVDQTNDVAYTPLPLDILAGLAQACQEIKTRLNAEIAAIQKQTPAAITKPSCQPKTAVGKLIAGLNGQTEADVVETLATLTDAEKARLDKLNVDLALEPTRAARQLLSLKGKVDSFVADLATLAKAVMDETAQILRDKANAYETARGAAQAASTALFADEPLPNIGSDVWRSLWEAARVYSQKEAYPDTPFPVTADPAVCVLCQQELSPTAAARVSRFEVFVKDQSKKREHETQESYTAAVNSFRAARFPMADLPAMLTCIRDELADEALANALRSSILSCVWRHRQIDRHHGPDSKASYPSAAMLPVDALRTHAADLAARAAGLTAEAGSEERYKLIAERDELLDRKWLSMEKADVLAEIDRRQQISALQTAVRC
jgi:energy-coupling factor transporter ATP-binding protein EcfA2